MLQSLPEAGTLRVDDLISDAGTSEAQAGLAGSECGLKPDEDASDGGEATGLTRHLETWWLDSRLLHLRSLCYGNRPFKAHTAS